MKKNILPALIMIPTIFIFVFYSCKNGDTNNEITKVVNNGRIKVENGSGKIDTVNYDCVGCQENIKDTVLFNKIIKEATLRTKTKLNYPLSFIPKKVELNLIKEDSIYYFENNEKIKNVLLVITKYKYIAKNGYGNELEGDALTSFYIKDNKIVDLEDEIKLEKLSFGKYINRNLTAYGEGDDFIEFIPTKDKSIIINSSLSCVDEGSLLQITLENDNEIKLRSWNDFNCDGTSYYKWFNKSQIDKLKASRIKYLFIYSRGESAMVSVPKNKSDYIQQLIDLYQKK